MISDAMIVILCKLCKCDVKSVVIYIKWNKPILLVTCYRFLEGVAAQAQIVVSRQVTHFDQ